MNNKSGKRLLLLAIMVLCAIAIPMLAQKDQQPGTPKTQGDTYKFSVKANLVIVPVIVTDKQGNHVGGLKAEDFELKEDGSVEKISRVDELTSDSIKAERPALQPNSFSNEVVSDHPKKLEILALDQLNTPFASSADANRGLLNYLAKNADPNTLLALVAFRGDGVHLIHNFTSDVSVLTAAIHKAQATLSVHDTLTQTVSGEGSEADAEAAMILALIAPVDFSSAVGANQTAAAARAAMAQMHAQVDSSRQSQGGLITLECLQQLSEYFANVPGRKSLIWASTAFPFSLGAQAGELTRGTTYDDWQRTFKMLIDANIAVYPVDVSGLTQAGPLTTLQATQGALGPEGGVAGRSKQLEGVTNGSFVDPSVGRHQTMNILADTTGGQAFYNSNNLSDLFHRAGDDCSQYYMLSYYTSGTGKPGWRKLSVKVHKDGVKSRARAGFFFIPAGANAALIARNEEIMAMTSELSFASVPISGRWMEVEPAGDQRKVHFALLIPPGIPLIDADHDRHISLDFRVVAIDSNGKTAGTIGQRMETNLPVEDAQTIQTKGIDYANQLVLAPGQYTVHFIVRDNLREALGSVVTSLRVQ
ncbi:MAG TPA: VWA domain-containing protein [Candidatus Angelobacter sp.]|nr:VWA domain-containing protein [Candidatus Angelobacter sp.]